MRKTISLMVLLFCVLCLNAQSNYKLGYIITNANDTLGGLIDFRTDQGVLSYLLQDAPALSQEIASTGFNRNSMVKLFKDYYKETSETGENCIVFVNDSSKKKHKSSILGIWRI
jgi:hypothetical protein